MIFWCELPTSWTFEAKRIVSLAAEWIASAAVIIRACMRTHYLGHKKVRSRAADCRRACSLAFSHASLTQSAGFPQLARKCFLHISQLFRGWDVNWSKTRMPGQSSDAFLSKNKLTEADRIFGLEDHVHLTRHRLRSFTGMSREQVGFLTYWPSCPSFRFQYNIQKRPQNQMVYQFIIILSPWESLSGTIPHCFPNTVKSCKICKDILE